MLSEFHFYNKNLNRLQELMSSILFLIGNKDYIQEHYLMQKNIRQREKYKGKRKRVKTKKRKDTKYIEGS